MMKPLLASLAFAGISMMATAGVTTVPNLAGTLKANVMALATDKDNNFYPMYVTNQDSVAVITILNRDFSVKKQFTINNIYEPADYDWRTESREVDCTYLWENTSGYEVGSSVYASQTIYNSDDKWEVVIRIMENEEERYIVVNEDNEEVCVPLGESWGEDWDTKSPAPYYYINGKFYLVEEGPGEIRFYTYESGSSAAPAISVDRSASMAYPNPLPVGRVLTIEFENEAESGTTVEVYDMRGRRVFSTAVAAGETKALIPSRRLHSGNYVYVVNRNGATAERGKIIAK